MTKDSGGITSIMTADVQGKGVLWEQSKQGWAIMGKF